MESREDEGEKLSVCLSLPLHPLQQRFHGEEECGGISILVVLNHKLCWHLPQRRQFH